MRASRLIPCCLLLAACAAAPVRQAAPHAVQDGHLRGLMAEMNGLVLSEKEMTEQQKDAKRREYSRQMAQTAAAMGKTVDAILARLPALKLSQPEQAAFQSLAGTLRRQAGTIQALAEGNFIDAIPAELDKADRTCQACHQLFRADRR